VTGRDVTPNLLTHLASPNAQVIHLHSRVSAAHALPRFAHHRQAESIGIG
jgi:hypothetical protein